MPTQLFPTSEDGPYDKVPVQLKVKPGVRERLKTVSDWQNKLRKVIDQILAEEGG